MRSQWLLAAAQGIPGLDRAAVITAAAFSRGAGSRDPARCADPRRTGDDAAEATRRSNLPGLCPDGTGVTVVVDFGRLGAASGSRCDPDGAGEERRRRSWSTPVSFWTASVRTLASSVPSSGRPNPDRSCGRVPPASAYWGLFWSDGSGKWYYADKGIDGIDAPEGGSIGWAWQSSRTQRAPGEPEPPAPSKPAGGSGGSTKPSPSPSQPSSTPSSSAPTPSGSSPRVRDAERVGRAGGRSEGG